MDSCSLTKKRFDFTPLKHWFLNTQRDLPWRVRRDPYAVWISEVMLQQTQVAVVLPYFDRWMKRFPSVASLAEAPLEEVIKLWEGLGYYSRARNLHEGARFILSRFNGIFPTTYETLSQIKGLGPYTVAAILSFAFRQREAVVDGNVLRVLARWQGLTLDIAKAGTATKMREFLDRELPDDEHWIVSEALIELGATLCQKKARCHECPLAVSCIAFRDGLTDRLPIKSKGAKAIYLYRLTGVIMHNDFVLLKKGKKGEVMSDLYEFPYFETSKEDFSSDHLLNKIREIFALPVDLKAPLERVKHSFTKYQVELRPFLFESVEKREVEAFEWIHKKDLRLLPFSSGHRKLLGQIEKVFNL